MENRVVKLELRFKVTLFMIFRFSKAAREVIWNSIEKQNTCLFVTYSGVIGEYGSLVFGLKDLRLPGVSISSCTIFFWQYLNQRYAYAILWSRWNCTTKETDNIPYKLWRSSYFSKLGLKNAYLESHLDGISSEIATVDTQFRLFPPLGLTMSPEIFQEIINQIISDLDDVKSRQDDTIVYDENMKV